MSLAQEHSLEQMEASLLATRSGPQPEISRPLTVIIVASIVATGFGPASVSATTSAAVTVSVRPGFVTRPYAINLRPIAGARKFTLYSTVKTAASAGISVDAAYPQALSAIAVMTAAWR